MDAAAPLLAWREVLSSLGGIGRDPERYGGAGFGNVSARLPPYTNARGRRSFLITGTQTGGLSALGVEHLCVVEAWDIERQRVTSRGGVLPSSESMTHGAVYDLGTHIRCVLHVHAPRLWRAARALRLPSTRSDVGYGTAEMAREVRRLWSGGTLEVVQLFAMLGHEDGVVVFGRSPQDAGARLVSWTARAWALDHER